MYTEARVIDQPDGMTVIEIPKFKCKIVFDCSGFGVAIKGYGDATSEAGCGQPVFIDFHEDNPDPKVIVWTDIKSQDPTHTIPLAKARESTRIEE